MEGDREGWPCFITTKSHIQLVLDQINSRFKFCSHLEFPKRGQVVEDRWWRTEGGGQVVGECSSQATVLKVAVVIKPTSSLVV